MTRPSPRVRDLCGAAALIASVSFVCGFFAGVGKGERDLENRVHDVAARDPAVSDVERLRLVRLFAEANGRVEHDR